MRYLRPSIAALSLVFCGCDLITSPHEGVRIALTLSSTKGPTLVDTPYGTAVSCELDLAAEAIGRGTASWMDGSFRIYIGRDTLTALDSGTVSRDEVQANWRAPGISAGETRHSTWIVTSGIPFSGAIDFRYQSSGGGDVSTATVRFRCSPPIPSSAAPPQLTITSVTPSSGTLTSGGSIVVSYSAYAAAGLWQTLVQLSGACDVHQLFDEKLQQAVTRSAVIPIPGDCALGVPLHVTIGAIDAAAQTSFRDQQLDLVLTDEQPPELTSLNFHTPAGGWQASPVSTYFGGDSIAVTVTASDNHALAFINWDLMPFGVRDSVAVSGLDAYRTLRIPLRPEWSGPIQLRMFVRDASGLSSAAVTTPADSVHVYPAIAHPTITGPYTGNARAVAVDTRRGLIYLGLGNEKQITILSMATLRVTGTLALPGLPVDMDLTPGGDSLLIALYGSRALEVVDLRASTPTLSALPLASLDSAAGQGTTGVRALANGHVMIGVGATQLASTALLDVDLATGAQRVRTDAAVNGVVGLIWLGRSADGKVMATNSPDTRCLRRYDVQSDSFGLCVTPRAPNLVPSLDAAGQRIAIHTDVYDAGMNLLPGGPDITPGGVTPSVLSADGATLLQFAGVWGIISRDAATGRILGKTPNLFQPDLPPRLSSDGNTIVVVNVYLPGWMIGTIDLR